MTKSILICILGKKSLDRPPVVLLQKSPVMTITATGIEVERDNMIEATATDHVPHLRREEEGVHTKIEIAKVTNHQAIVEVEAGVEALTEKDRDESLHHRTRK